MSKPIDQDRQQRIVEARQSLEQLAASFLTSHIRQTGAEIPEVICHVDKRQVEVASHADVRNFIATLEQPDERYDATEVISEAEAAELAEEKLSVASEMILIRRRRGLQVFTGFLREKPIWASASLRLGHRFADEHEIIAACFRLEGSELKLKPEFESAEAWPASKVRP